MSRLPIRARLTLVFALAMTVVLAGAALFVYTRLRDDLDEGITEALRARLVGTFGDPEDQFGQLIAPDGRILAGLDVPVLLPSEIERATHGEVLLERRVQGIDGKARVLAKPDELNVVVAGQSLADRDETLNGLVASFAIGGPIAVLLASLLGYGLATAGLRPVEAMRRRADEVSDEPEPLPLPRAHDEIHRLGTTLNAMLDRLRRALERERRFVADASHELRTPIAVVKTEVETALRTPGLPERARASLLAAVAECDRLAQLAEDLLVLARSADGQLAIRTEPLDAKAALDDARERFAQRGRTIRVDAPVGLKVSADELRLRQALNNLVDNALRHGAGDVTLSARPNGSGVELEVADEGSGFGAEQFERFARGDEARTRGGAGLGLAIVKSIAEAHGGSASVDGAAVRLWLPSQAPLIRR